MRKAIAVSVILLLAANLLTACSLAQPQTAAGPPAATHEPAQASSAWTQALRAETDLAHFKQAPVYQISLDYEPSSRQLSGSQTIRYTNPTDRSLSTIYLQTAAPVWGKAENEAERFSLSALEVDGKPAAHTQESQFITVPLHAPLAPGAAVNLSFSHQAHLPIFRGGQAGNANANPGTYGAINQQTHGFSAAIPVAVPEMEAPGPQFILWDITVSLPAGWNVVGSGVTVGPASPLSERQVTRVLSASYSLFLFATWGLRSAPADVGGVTVTVHYPGSAGSMGPELLGEAVQLLQAYEAMLGGKNRSGLVMIDTHFLSSRTVQAPPDVTDPWVRLVTSVSRDDQRRLLLAHEIAHAWWGDLVWQDPRAPSWMEGLSEASAIAAVERVYGTGAATAARNHNIYVYQWARAHGLADMAHGRPRPESVSEQDCHAMSYYKPALFYDQVRRLVGDEAFYAAMRRYIEQNRFRVTADGGPIEELLGNPEVNALHQRWLLETHGDEDLGMLTPDQLKQLRSLQ